MATQNTEERLGLSLANPNPLGYGALGILLWMHGLIFAGWFPQSYGYMIEEVTVVFAIGALLVAGLAAFLRGWTWGGMLFLFWSTLEFGIVRARTNEIGAESYQSWLWLTIAVFHALLAWAAFQKGERRLFRGLIALGFMLAGLGHTIRFSWLEMGAGGILSGYAQLAAALVAFWVCATELRFEAHKDLAG